MYHLIVPLIAILICYKWGDWRNWKQYYPTILFFIIGNLACELLTYNKPLWLYHSQILGHTFTNLLVTITVFPSTVLVFIPNFPKGTFKRILYLSFFVLLYAAFEFISLKLGYFKHLNGWSMMYTVIFDYSMLLLLIIHHKWPLAAWCIALITPHILLYLFKIPYSIIR